MTSHFFTKKSAWIIPLLILAATVILLSRAPSEATIGGGIHIVYIHVAFIWTGMAGLLVAALLGLVVVATNRPAVHGWMATTAWVSLAFFAVGVGTSLIAEQVNWGGIAWREPRTFANLNLLALATILIVGGSLAGRPRIQAGLYLALAVALIWITATTELQLHPAGAVSSSTSGAIQFTFYGLFALCLLAGSWLVWFWHGWQQGR